jgi:transketolase
MALTSTSTPSILALTRQNLPQLENSTIENAIKGAYVAVEEPNADITLVSTGSEVGICIEALKQLSDQGIKARVVSMPCTEVFDAQPKDYQLKVLPDGKPIMSVEVMSTFGWEKYSHEQFGLNRFGASGPYKDVYKVSRSFPPQLPDLTHSQKFEFTPEGIAKRAKQTIDFYKGINPRSPINRAFQQIL